MLATSSHASNPSLYRKVNYDPVKDFAGITLIARIAGLLVVPVDSPATSVRELIALAKAKPGALAFASGGNGSQAHFAGEMFKNAAGVDIMHVPYKGAPEIMTSLLSGQTAMGFPTLPTALPQVKAGKVRALAVTSVARNPKLPEIPTMREAMDNGFDLNAWFGVVAPAGVPSAIVTRLNAEIIRILSDPEVRDRLSADGSEIVTTTPQEFSALIKADVAVWADIVKASGVKLD
jgi:tripartite-type tricarboxylate transporter receptor subunit TctC